MILWKCLDEAQDYFARLGGSGRYSSFKEWHPFALVLLTVLELKEPSVIIQRIKIEQSLPDQLWEKTDGLPALIKRKMTDQVVTKEMVEEFISKTTGYLSKLPSPKELSQWLSFLDSIKDLLGIK
ncbi:hypothetical protein [Polynucleobacter sp. 80A-SIGWE]|uniref:hypothetical protein n=1 Tax=Polynucleobacter sp. 80A-SIGWE TaxID=2689100 RepID=UPI001C0CF1F1|nr:hypothetical protein [Polynucleobacter sp. 80A-SIGWE]